MPRRSPRGEPEPRVQSSRHPTPAGRSLDIKENTGIASTGHYARNIQFRVEGEFPYQITALPQAGRYHEPWHEQPSQLLLAQHQVVPFTVREDELIDLRTWRDEPGGPQAAARLLHAPGGQGKTRLALKLGAETSDDWRVWQATAHAAGRAARPVGWTRRSVGQRVLIIADYAERWPASALLALMRDLASRPCERLRVLLIARSAGNWWVSIRHDLREMGYGVTVMPLGPLEAGAAGDRQRAYLAARDRFAETLGLADPGVVEIPVDLDDPSFGLTLTVHMAALAAVDAHVTGRVPPSDPEALSAYLIDRERAHWEKLHTSGRVSVEAATMAQVVYTATLAGRLSYADGQSALERASVESGKPPGVLLKDHVLAYPASIAGGYLEPLYPDRLGEDFIALTTPGHRRPYQSDPWAGTAIAGLLAPSEDSPPAVWTGHTFGVLIETARRWSHIASGQLWPLLRAKPRLALEAGGTALAALSSLPDIDMEVLAAIEACMPDRHSDLDVGMAALAQRLGQHRLASVRDPAERARIHNKVSRRMLHAGLHDQGIQPAKEAVRLYRELARRDPARYQEDLARELNTLGIHFDLTRQDDQALAATEEAADIFRKLVHDGRTGLEPTLGRVEHPGFLGGRDLWEGWGSWCRGSRIPLSCGNGL